jgi:hypothetical protein
MKWQAAPQGVGIRTSSGARLSGLVGTCLLLVALLVSACGSATPMGPTPGFAGYDWQVVTISHNGTVRSIPGGLRVGLQFSPDGQFGANDGVNFHSGTYRATGNGFTVSAMKTTLVGYAGHDPIALLAISAIGSFNDGVHATATLTGDRLVVGVGAYTLTCQRHGPAA